MVQMMVKPDCLLLWLLELVSWSLSNESPSLMSADGVICVNEKWCHDSVPKGCLLFLLVLVFLIVFRLHVKFLRQVVNVNCLHSICLLNWRLSKRICLKSVCLVFICEIGLNSLSYNNDIGKEGACNKTTLTKVVTIDIDAKVLNAKSIIVCTSCLESWHVFFLRGVLLICVGMLLFCLAVAPASQIQLVTN